MKKISKFFTLLFLLAGVAVLSLVVKAKIGNGSHVAKNGLLAGIIPSASADVPPPPPEIPSCSEMCSCDGGI